MYWLLHHILLIWCRWAGVAVKSILLADTTSIFSPCNITKFFKLKAAVHLHYKSSGFPWMVHAKVSKDFVPCFIDFSRKSSQSTMNFNYFLDMFNSLVDIIAPPCIWKTRNEQLSTFKCLLFIKPSLIREFLFWFVGTENLIHKS